MFKRNLNRGFTLIELLVVIAIIGILAATVLASLGTARQSGSNASAKGSVSSVRAQAEIFYNTGGTYSGMCASTQVQALTAAARANGMGGSGAAAAPTAANNTTASAWNLTTAVSNVTACHETASQWAVSVPLNGAAQNFFCADSTGAAKETGTALAASTYVCP